MIKLVFVECRCHCLLGCSCAACWGVFLPPDVFGENQTPLCSCRPCFLWLVFSCSPSKWKKYILVPVKILSFSRILVFSLCCWFYLSCKSVDQIWKQNCSTSCGQQPESCYCFFILLHFHLGNSFLLTTLNSFLLYVEFLDEHISFSY